MTEGHTETVEVVGTLTRRRLIGMGIGGGAVLTLAAGGPASALARVLSADVFSRATYTPLIGQSFTVKGLKTPLRLLSVGDVPFRPAGSDLAFILGFDAPAHVTALPGDPSLLSHPRLGQFGMFLTPGTASGGREPFTAIVDRTYS
jgi:hypothetical protein